MRRGKVNWLIVTRGERGQWETKNKTELFTSYLMAKSVRKPHYGRRLIVLSTFTVTAVPRHRATLEDCSTETPMEGGRSKSYSGSPPPQSGDRSKASSRTLNT